MKNIFLTIVFCMYAAAQNGGPDSARLEITGSYWSINSSGFIKALGTPVDLNSDLGVSQEQATFTGKLVAAPRRKHKIVVEGTPFRLTGNINLSRSITYSGRTYNVNEHVISSADLNYLYGGYQYDVFSHAAGHVGLGIGGAWLNADGTIRGVSSGIMASKTETIGLPLASLEGRVFPVRGPVLVEINAEVKGMSLGKYGHYVQATVGAGIGVRRVFVEGGYRIVNLDIHTSDDTTAVSPQFSGPVVSVVFRVP